MLIVIESQSTASRSSCLFNLSLLVVKGPLLAIKPLFYEDRTKRHMICIFTYRDDNQLLGRLSMTPSSDCEPFAHAEVDGKRKPVAPCGAIANSLFNGKMVTSYLITYIIALLICMSNLV